MGIDAYEEVGPLDAQVMAVAWHHPANLRMVAATSFETFDDNGVRFIDLSSGFREEGTDDDVYSLEWVDTDGQRQTTQLGTRDSPT
jgi:hypothetical protein